MDYTENYTFATQEGGSGGIPLHIYGTEYMGGGSGSSNHIYFPGGLYVNSVLSDILETDFDHTTKNVFENYDVFLDLVSSSSSVSKRPRHTKKIIFKKSKRSRKHIA